MERTHDPLSRAIEKLVRRYRTGEITEAEYRAARDRLLERRVRQRPFVGEDRRQG